MAKSILDEAMEDAKLLKETAIENAKNVLVEAISPKIKEFVDAQLGETGMDEAGMYEDPALDPMGGMMGMQEVPAADPMMDPGMEDHGDLKQDLQMLIQLLKKAGLTDKPASKPSPKPAKSDKPDKKEKVDEMAVDEAAIEEMNMEEGTLEEEQVDEANVDEVVDITTEDLKSALSEVLGGMDLKSEAHVTKGFGPVQDATLKSAGGKMQKGLADEKAGEHQWTDVEPPDAKDWTVKEAAYRKNIEVLKRYSTALKTENTKYKQAYEHLKRNLQEVNLFNSKLLYTNKLLHSAELNNKQRLGVIEAFDRAQSLREVELVYKSLSESLKIAGVLGESKQVQRPSMKGPKGSRYTTPSSTVLQESMSKEQDGDGFAGRMQELAGLVD